MLAASPLSRTWAQLTPLSPLLVLCRAEILGALASVLMIWALVGVLVYEAILRLIADVEYARPLSLSLSPLLARVARMAKRGAVDLFRVSQALCCAGGMARLLTVAS